MSLQLEKPDLYRYNNPDHVQFHELALDLFTKNEDNINAGALLTTYKAKLKQEDTIYKYLRGSEFTKKRIEIDHQRDLVFTAFTATIRADEKHFDPAIRDHARHVGHLVENYGRLYEAGFDAETSGIDSIIEKLLSNPYKPSVQALQLAVYINELKRLNDLFKEVAVESSDENVARPDITMRTARKESDAAMRAIAALVDARIIVSGDYLFKGVVASFNEHVNHFNSLVHEHYGRLHAKTDIANALVDAIGTQAYTGHPVNVIPTVHLRKIEKDGTETLIELVFSQDFTVGYRNNVEVGTASLIISGMGKYTGEITDLFNIERSE
jgi:hypothetical protein